MDKGSCHQKVRKRRSRRRFAEPLSTIILKDAPCSLSQWHHSVFLRPVHDLKSYLVPEKDASVKCLDAVLGKVHLPCWSFIVVRNGPGVVFILSFCVCGMVMCTGTSTAFCSSDESPPTYNHSSKHAFFKVSPVGIQYTNSRAL